VIPETLEEGVDLCADPGGDNDEECGRGFEDPSETLYDEDDDE